MPSAPDPPPGAAASGFADGDVRLTRAGLRSRLPAAGVADDERFRIEHVLGIGSTGQVFSVHDAELDRRIAVKVLSHDACADGEQVRHFLREARLTASLQHPNVLPVHDIDVTEDGRPFFSMDHVRGRTLESALEDPEHAIARRDPSAVNLIVKMFIDVGNAVAFAHHRGIVHQDIKPENILLGDFGEVLVLDWGSAFRGEASREGIYGTPLYMSPEQANGASVDARSDIWCIGASLFHALTLRAPTWSDDSDEFWRRKRSGAIDPLTAAERAAAPGPLLAIALKALAADPAARYQRLLDMVRDLEAFQGGLAVSAYHDTLAGALKRWYRRHAAPFWLATAAVALLAILFLVVATERAKRSSDWRVVHETVGADRAQVSARWEGRRGEWHRAVEPLPLSDARHFDIGADGIRLIAPIDGFINLSYANPFQGALRVEWTVTARMYGRDLNCFLNASDRVSGYTFHVGGYGDARNVRLTRGENVFAEATLAEPIESGRAYRMAMERLDHHVRLTIDGVVVIDAVDADPFDAPDAGGFGFDTCIGNDIVISAIRVSSKPLPQMVPANAVADRLLRIKQYAQARAQYAEIAETYAGTAMAADARFRVGLCDVRGGDEIEGLATLRRFEEEFPGHDCVPYALYERAMAALRRGEHADAELLMKQVKGHRGHPVLRRMFFDASRRYTEELRPRPIVRLGDSRFPPDAVARIDARLVELRELGALCGAPLHAHAPELIGWLRELNAQEVTLAHFSDPHVRATALNDQGRYDEVLRDYGEVVPQIYAALYCSGRFDELMAKRLEGHETILALWRTGRIEEGSGQTRQVWLWQWLAGRDEEILREAIRPHDGVALSLIRTGRAAEVLERKMSPWCMGAALCALGRYEEVLDYPEDVEHPWQTALHRYRTGRTAEARALLDLLIPQLGTDATGNVCFGRYILPSFLDALEGRLGHEARLRAVAARLPYAFAQTVAHQARFLAGDIGEAEFRVQPYRVTLEFYLLLVQAMRADMGGDRAKAHERYAKLRALPAWQREDDGLISDFTAWRFDATAPSTP